jgi:YesN/AraC family two-component response regulator
MQSLMERGMDETGDRATKSVLIVDDDEVFRQALAEGIGLMDPDLSVYTAENGEEAVAVVRNAAVDIVITDLRMPVMDGAELALWLSEDRPSLPVIVMSAYAENGMVSSLKKQGNHFLDKPLDFDRLKMMIKAILH